MASWKGGHPAGPPPRISVVLRTGGAAANFTARREYLVATLESLTGHVRVADQSLVDSPSVVRLAAFSDWPDQLTPELEAAVKPFGFYVVGAAPGDDGHYTSSMGRLWRYLASRRDPFDYVLLVEDDFLFERDVDLVDLVDVLATRPHLVQLALLRDAYYPRERDAGGVLGHPVEEFTPVQDGTRQWLEHTRFFTMNPNLFRRTLTSERWPTGTNSEAIFGRQLFRADGRRRAALWGGGEAWVTHLGAVRAGAGY